jgi:peptide chain release factor 1
MEAVLLKKWESVASRFQELTDQLMDPSVVSQPGQLHKLSKERMDLEPAAQFFETYCGNARQLEEAAQILADPSAGSDMHKMAADETAELQRQQGILEEQVKEFLIPKDPRDEKSLLLEIRAGTGGDEAALFAGELFRLYIKYAEQKGFKVDTVEATETGIGGYKNITALIEGKGAYSHFKYEAGVHRVQRVPVTEAAGRIHTSTVTVAVMPEVDEVDVKIDPGDLRIDTFCSSGAGGQSVNTTKSAVRIFPPGLW